MKLTRENTALDLSKLTDGEKVELCSLLNNTSFIRDYPEAWIMYFDEELKFYRTCWDGYIGIKGKEIVDFQTFKSIHFPEQNEKPTYEELVEALRDVFDGCDGNNFVCYREKYEQLLERIK